MVVAQNRHRRNFLPFGQINFQAFSSLRAWPLLTAAHEGTPSPHSLAVQCSHILCPCIHHLDKAKLEKDSTWSQTPSLIDIPSANPPRLKLGSTGNNPLAVPWRTPGYPPSQSVVLCLGTGAVQRELNATAMAQTGSILLGNNLLLFYLLFCALYHEWLPPNQITAGTAKTGFLSWTAANGSFLLPF